MICLGRFRTLDGAPRGRQARVWEWTCFDDVLRYRDQQLDLMDAGAITYQLFRIRIRRVCARYREMQSNRLYWKEQARLRAEQQTKETNL